MAERFISKIDKRVIFSSGAQCRFLLKVKEKTRLPWILFLKNIGVQRRTFNDWKRERYSLPLSTLKKICRLAEMKFPKGIKIKEPFWYVYKGAKAGGIAMYKKYGRVGGNPEYRKKKWRKWWEARGKYEKHPIINVSKPIQKPYFSKELAEFVGIILGDGGISKRQVIVTLNRESEKLYSVFVADIIKKLFWVEPSIYNRKDESVINIITSRTQLVLFCESIGLRVGNKLKQNLDIPRWIMQNKSFKIACVRGLVDTDGCIFQECHKINNKKYCYPRLVFTSYSRLLCSSVVKILKDFGFSPRIRVGRNVQLENKEEIIRYFKLIGTNNEYHKKRFESFMEG